jgi:glycerol-3-phosphate dehydrogenase
MSQAPPAGETSRASRLGRLGSEVFDVLVVGGGIAAVCAAWDAALRGLRVALVERLDFGAGASAHSLKVLHGGVRYLQHLDFHRLSESCRERSAFLRIAPHLTRPLAFAVPTYGYGLQGKWPLRAAFGVLECVTWDRNRGTADPHQHIPTPHMLNRAEVLARFPGLPDRGLTGAGVFYDGQVINPTRLVLSVAQAAAALGAVCMNYCQATRLLIQDGRVGGVLAHDLMSDERFEIKARVTINATGPFAPAFLHQSGAPDALPVPLSRDMAFVVRRQLCPDMAVAVQTRYRDPDALLTRGNRHLFVVPWLEAYTLIGVHSRVFVDDPYELTVTEQEIEDFLSEIGEAFPAFGAKREDVTVVNAGLLPFGENQADTRNLSFGKRSAIVDHAHRDGLEGLVTGMSVRWTMGRLVGEQLIDLAKAKLGRELPPSRTATTPVWGGDMESVEDLGRQARQGLPALSDVQVARLVRNYGTEWRRLATPSVMAEGMVGESDHLVGEVRHAVRSEMAMSLTDVVMRRLELGAGECPPAATLAACAAIVGQELGWSAGRHDREIEQVRASYPFASPRSQLPLSMP